MRAATLILLAATSLGVAAPAYAAPASYEQQLADQEQSMVLVEPLAGRENKYWFHYNTDIQEARLELKRDLKHASDTEDVRDAWDEYRVELADARKDYTKEMRERGYPVVYVE